MSSKLISALIILTVAALCAAAAFQYLEMESFGLPETLKERFFPEKQSAPAESSSQPAADAPADNNTETPAAP
ncbi:MAG: hypothetical protein IKB77_03980 [Lentisphaeria bacterium]|nr:hypothetical protein [Lentisphaeria bacterium]